MKKIIFALPFVALLAGCPNVMDAVFGPDEPAQDANTVDVVVNPNVVVDSNTVANPNTAADSNAVVNPNQAQ